MAVIAAAVAPPVSAAAAALTGGVVAEVGAKASAAAVGVVAAAAVVVTNVGRVIVLTVLPAITFVPEKPRTDAILCVWSCGGVWRVVRGLSLHFVEYSVCEVLCVCVVWWC